jgi:hypothetical protein
MKKEIIVLIIVFVAIAALIILLYYNNKKKTTSSKSIVNSLIANPVIAVTNPGMKGAKGSTIYSRKLLSSEDIQ